MVGTAGWATGGPLVGGRAVGWATGGPLGRGGIVSWATGGPLGRGGIVSWAAGGPLGRAGADSWATGGPLGKVGAVNSLERELLKLISPALLVIDDFGLERLTLEQAHDFYEIISERYEWGFTIITSNRHVTEWVSLFDDQILANSALDRLAHNAHQMIIEGESYRKKEGTTGRKL